MPVKVKAAAASVAVTLLDDGSDLISVSFTDNDGVPVTAAQLNGTWPAAVAIPTFTFADATPGPSAFAYNPQPLPTVSTKVPGAFDIGNVVAMQPVVAGSGQAIDSTLTIASGLPTAPYAADGGTWTITSDPNALGGASVVVT